MANDCRYTVDIGGVKIPFTENDLKAYLLKGGKKAFDKISTQNISAENRKRLDATVDAIVNGATTKQQVFDFIDSKKGSEKSKQEYKDYVKEQLRLRKKGTYEGLTDNQKAVYDILEDSYLNGDMSYEEVTDELDYIIDRQEDENAKGIIEEIKNIFFKNNQRRQEKEIKQEVKQEAKDFESEIASHDFGLSDTDLTVLQSDKRLLRSGTDFIDDLSLVTENDQIRAMFDFAKYASDIDYIISRFQQQYGEGEYLDKMISFVENHVNEKKNPMAAVSVSVALNRHLQYLMSKEEVPNRAKLLALKLKNDRLSQKLGTEGSLLLNALRAWNGDLLDDVAWVGLVDAPTRKKAEEIKAALGVELTDEDLIADEEGNLDYFEEEAEEAPVPKKSPSYSVRKYFKKESKKSVAKEKEVLKEEIEKQKKKCK